MAPAAGDHPNPNPNPKPPKKHKNSTPESEFRRSLDTCSRTGDLPAALALYHSAISDGIRLSSYHFTTLLHIISASLETLENPSAIDTAFQIFYRMIATGAVPTEATVTTMARIAAHRSHGGGDLAFDLVKTMGEKYRATPKLRTYQPALFAFCRNLEADKAYEVENHMVSMGVSPEENEIAALLEVSAKTGREEKVYEYLLKLRGCVGCVSLSTAGILESWFRSEKAAEIGRVERDEDCVKEAILVNGGGWHGMGWLGKGRWQVRRGSVGEKGCCDCCGQQLASVDIDLKETERFAESLASLALEREAQSNFSEFQEWLENHAKYEAIVDGANVGLYQQNFANGGFSLSQLDAVVKELFERSQGKWPLVILHDKRLRALMENPSNRQLLATWKAEGALYTTPIGSNDDWYWLYAAVKLKCLLVTNDEMRDHIFELLGSSFFPKWKERHQVRYAFVKSDLRLVMPAPYSLVIQESENGSWHAPLDDKYQDERSRVCLCLIRPSLCKDPNVPFDTAHYIDTAAENENGNGKTVCSTTGKRKERSPSPTEPPAV